MSPQGKVYGLYHPQTGELRYVGQTWVSLSRRLTGHMYVAKHSEHHRRHVVAWIRSLLKDGLRPKIIELGRASNPEDLDLLEVKCISEARSQGCRLTNHADGGKGNHGRKLLPSHRAKLHNPEVWARMAATRKGQPSPMKGRHHTAKTKTKISAAKSGKLGKLRKDVSTETMIDYLRHGVSVTQVAESLGVNRTTVRNRLRRAKHLGVEVPLLKRCIPTDLICQKLFDRSLSYAQVAVELGVSVEFLRTRLSRARRSGKTIPKFCPGPKLAEQQGM